MASFRFQCLVAINRRGLFRPDGTARLTSARRSDTATSSRVLTLAAVNGMKKANACNLVKLRGRTLKNYEVALQGVGLTTRCGNDPYQIVAIPCLIAK